MLYQVPIVMVHYTLIQLYQYHIKIFLIHEGLPKLSLTNSHFCYTKKLVVLVKNDYTMI